MNTRASADAVVLVVLFVFVLVGISRCLATPPAAESANPQEPVEDVDSEDDEVDVDIKRPHSV